MACLHPFSVRDFHRPLLLCLGFSCLSGCSSESASPPPTDNTAGATAQAGSSPGGAPSMAGAGPVGGTGGTGGVPGPNVGGAGGGENMAGAQNMAGTMNTGGTGGEAPMGGAGGESTGGSGGAADPTVELEVDCDPDSAGKPELASVLSLRGNPVDGGFQYLDACGFCHASDGAGMIINENVPVPSLHSLPWTCEEVETLLNGKMDTPMLAFSDRGEQWLADMIAYTLTEFTDPKPALAE